MAKKVKCIDCENGMNWALPVRVSANNLDYAKWCLRLAKNTVVCDRTHKTKPKGHEQYCKHYHEKTHRFDQSAEIEALEKMIEEFEGQVERMTVQEAIDLIKQVPLYRYECELEKGRQSDLFKALHLSIKAMEKQIPKKVETWANGTHHCPNEDCYYNEFNLPYEHEFAYCPECGQKLDWSEEE